MPYGAVAALCCCTLLLPLTLNRQWHSWGGMSDAGLIVPGMTGTLSRYDVTITVDRDGGYLSNPVEFAAAAGQAALRRAAIIVSAHTAEQIISVVTVEATGTEHRQSISPVDA
jgi:hypothetical protein